MDRIMITCPYCQHENIEGVDVCEQCEQALSDVNLSSPLTAVEKGLLKDKISRLESKSPVIVRESDTVGDVISQIVKQGTGCAFVANSDENAGWRIQRTRCTAKAQRQPSGKMGSASHRIHDSQSPGTTIDGHDCVRRQSNGRGSLPPYPHFG